MDGTVGLQERFKELVDKRDKLLNEKIQLETKVSVAKEDLKKEYELLKSEFNISSVEEAQDTLLSLEKEIGTKLNECEEYLKGFEV